MKKVVLITGATGQDGSYMAEYLLERTENTLILAARRTSQAILSNIEHLLDNRRVILIDLDLMDGQAIRSTINRVKPHYFINLGAQTFVSDSWGHPEQHMQVNATALIHILEAVREHCPTCRVYSAGSSEQFGNGNHPYSPRSMYGVSKCTASLIAKVYRESYNLYVVHGILYNHESERRQDYFVTRKITRGVARIKRALELGKEFESIELGNLDAKRDWSHASDFVDGIWRMLNQDSYRNNINDLINEFDRSGHILLPRGVNPSWHDLLVKNIKDYILASGETHSIREFAELAFKEAGIEGYWYNNFLVDSQKERFYLKNSKIEEEAEYAGDFDIIDDNCSLVKINPRYYRPADVEHLCGDATLARTELGWEPKISFKELVNRMVQNDLKNV